MKFNELKLAHFAQNFFWAMYKTQITQIIGLEPMTYFLEGNCSTNWTKLAVKSICWMCLYVFHLLRFLFIYCSANRKPHITVFSFFSFELRLLGLCASGSLVGIRALWADILLYVMWAEPTFEGVCIGAQGGIRTHTAMLLRHLPPAIGLLEHFGGHGGDRTHDVHRLGNRF